MRCLTGVGAVPVDGKGQVLLRVGKDLADADRVRDVRLIADAEDAAVPSNACVEVRDSDRDVVYWLPRQTAD